MKGKYLKEDVKATYHKIQQSMKLRYCFQLIGDIHLLKSETIHSFYFDLKISNLVKQCFDFIIQDGEQ